MWFNLCVVEKDSQGDRDRRNCLFRSRVELISLQLQGQARRRHFRHPAASACQTLAPWRDEAEHPKYQVSERAPLSPPNPACPSWHEGIAPFPTLLKIKQSIRALLSGSDIPRCGLTPPQGHGAVKIGENQLIKKSAHRLCLAAHHCS